MHIIINIVVVVVVIVLIVVVVLVTWILDAIMFTVKMIIIKSVFA